MAKKDHHKIAFADPYCSKYAMQVMPFGLINRPFVFIIFIFDMDSTWNFLTNNPCIIVDDGSSIIIIVEKNSWAKAFEVFINFLTYQFKVCLSQNLQLPLKKNFFCPERQGFLGCDNYENDNILTKTKHTLLKAWLSFKIACCIASFQGYLNFYLIYIPYFE